MSLTLEQIDAFANSLDEELVDEICTLAKRGLLTTLRPIDEAPKDGTEILAFTERGRSEVMCFDEISRTWRGPYSGFDLAHPSHFIPLTALETP